MRICGSAPSDGPVVGGKEGLVAAFPAPASARKLLSSVVGRLRIVRGFTSDERARSGPCKARGSNRGGSAMLQPLRIATAAAAASDRALVRSDFEIMTAPSQGNRCG